MKSLFILLILFSTNSFANEIRTFGNEKFVMFTTQTATKAELILKDRVLSKQEKIVKLKKVFKSETKFCAVAGKTYATQNRPAAKVNEKCQELLFGNYFADDLASQGLEADELNDVQVTLSQYFALLLKY